MKRTVAAAFAELASIGAITAGVFAEFGVGWSMIVAGILILVMVEIYGVDSNRTEQ